MITIRLNDEQLEIVNDAIALYNRVVSGDLFAIAEQIRAFRPVTPETALHVSTLVGEEQLDRIDGLLRTASVILNRTNEDLSCFKFCQPTGNEFTLDLTTHFPSSNARQFIDVIDLYVRIGLGQIDTYIKCLYNPPLTYSDNRCILNALEENALIITRNLGFDRGHSWSIMSDGMPERAKIAYDIECVIRKVVAELEEQGKHSVWHRDPLHTCKRVPLATVSVANN